MFLSVDDIKTHLRPEITNQITRGDDTLIVAAIDAAVVQIKSYLGAYDIEKIFNATVPNALLLIFSKDIAVWHLINICNAGTDLELRETRYKEAIAWLRDVQEGDTTPDLPKKPTTPESGGGILYSSNPKRTQHF